MLGLAEGTLAIGVELGEYSDLNVRCRGCGSRLFDTGAPCSVCGVSAAKERRFWRFMWGGIGLSTILIIIVVAIVLYAAPRYAPHLFQPDPRNVLP